MNALTISTFLNKLLEVDTFEDACYNGLQIENTGDVTKIGFAVDACLETFQKAVKEGCQMLIVHHGLIWDGLKHIQGNTYHKVKYLIKNNLALYAAHLPLDAHPQYGNNVQIAQLLKLKDIQPFGLYQQQHIGCQGTCNTSLEKIQEILKTHKMNTTTLPFGSSNISSVGIISGGAAKDTSQAIQAKVDLYITGESLHHIHHLAKENHINVIFAGHYQTEVWGVKALMPVLHETFNTQNQFLDVPTLI